jgi:hypothetical protein
MGLFKSVAADRHDKIFTDEVVTCRHPGENRGPENSKSFKNLDAGFRRHDNKKAFPNFFRNHDY